MKIAVDISPIESTNSNHKVRGVGSYTGLLHNNLQKYDSKNSYIFFSWQKEFIKDVNIIHFPYFEPFFLSLKLSDRVKIVVTVHDLIPLRFPTHFPTGFLGTFKWFIQKNKLKRVDAIITDSENSKKDIIQLTKADIKKVHVVYLAASSDFKKINNSSILQGIIAKYKLPEKFALYVGDVTWNKNLPRLIEAVKKAGVTLATVGKALVDENFDRTNPWNRDLVRVQELVKGDKQIMRLGFIPIQDLVSLYNAATVFVMPSFYEGFGLPVLEAMQCGCPVVTTREGSLSEVGGDAVHYVDPYNVNSIAEGIKEVFESEKLRNKLCKMGLKQAEKFNIKKTITETTHVYDKVYNSR